MEVKKGEIIKLTDNREYVCLSVIISEDNKRFLYLVTTSKPLKFCFAEETLVDGIIKMRVIGSKNEKQKLFNLLKAKSETNSNQGSQYVQSK